MNALILCAVVVTAVPMYSMENESVDVIGIEEIVEQQPVTVWYKKRSVKIAAITTAAAVYAYAVHIGKISIPAFLLGLFAAEIVQNNIINSDLDNDNDQNEKIVIAPDTNNEQQDEQTIIKDNNSLIDSTPKTVETKKQTVGRWEQTQKAFGKFIYKLPKKAPHITTEDLHQINEHQQR